MGIRARMEYEEASCDACGRSLRDAGNVHYASLVPSFGYGSILDDAVPQGAQDLCAFCYLRACLALGLPVEEDALKETAKLWGDREGARVLEVSRAGVRYDREGLFAPQTAGWDQVLANPEETDGRDSA